MIPPAQAGVQELFDANAATYDRVNTVISLGLDRHWRGWAARRAVVRPGARVLDAFAGTGLVGLRAAELGAEVTLADISPSMLAVARRRALQSGLDVQIVTRDLVTDPGALAGDRFDAVTMVFGARYLDAPAEVIRGLSALLVDGGTFVLMDFVEPDAGLWSRIAAVYFFRVLPRLAGLLAGDRELYDRLAATTHAMHGRERLAGFVSEAGLEIVETRTMGFGLVAGVVGRKVAG